MLKTALAFLLLFLASPPLLACSCIRSGSQDDQVRRGFKASEAVFSAYVAGVAYVDIRGQRTRMLKLRILQVWKGDLSPNTWLDVVSDDELGLMGCSYVAEQNDALLIYAQGEQPYFLGSCSLTGPLDRATTDIPLLNKLSKIGS